MIEVGRSEDLGRFTYEKPLAQAAPTTVVPLGQTDVLTVEMRVVQSGTPSVFEADPTTECVWFVVGGRARFYDGVDALVGEFGESEGVAVPRSIAYRFEAVGDADLQVLHIAAVDPRLGAEVQSERTAMQPVIYESPEFDEGSDIQVPRVWVGDDMLAVTVEKVRDGGGDDLPHAHFGIVGAWFLLSGRVRFHGASDDEAFEMTTHDAVFLPSGTAYGFRALDHEPAEFLHVKALDLGTEKHVRVDY
jgi:mannose-6-phosphate isomerase-like protein (cupin superfamily)